MKPALARKMMRLRWFVLGAWLLGVGIHLSIFISLPLPPNGVEWYASLAGFRGIVFLLTRLPLWVAGLCMLALVGYRIRHGRG
ncbi:hypothetical protein LBW59_16650 [Ralstonia solanacearum]|uniref:Transmembrane protein n=1 Tax=Ralstonia solanacearum TaxID=305 RepID=A0AAW5ZQL4_RALSL|nr:hypothetical protein [Ralstonia solanacearum]MDB0572392.1 hypothetical protein [Ralstonia solanacearum]CBJ41836.1 protein of unknown function [Ralstonia solanacearum CFBP2957]